jgi:hypothetical protein
VKQKRLEIYKRDDAPEEEKIQEYFSKIKLRGINLKHVPRNG